MRTRARDMKQYHETVKESKMSIFMMTALVMLDNNLFGFLLVVAVISSSSSFSSVRTHRFVAALFFR